MLKEHQTNLVTAQARTHLPLGLTVLLPIAAMVHHLPMATLADMYPAAMGSPLSSLMVRD